MVALNVFQKYDGFITTNENMMVKSTQITKYSVFFFIFPMSNKLIEDKNTVF